MQIPDIEKEKYRSNLAFGFVLFAALFPLLMQAGRWIPADLSLPAKIMCGIIITQGFLILGVLLPFFLTNTPLQEIPEKLGLKKISKAELKRIALLAIPVFLLTSASSTLLTWIAKFFGVHDALQQVVRMLLEAPWPVFFTIAFSAVLIAPVVEELAFRRVLYSWFKDHLPPTAAITAASLIFAAVHATLWQIPALFLLAVIFQLEYIRSGHNTTYTILMHSAYNSITIIAACVMRFGTALV